VMVRWDGVKDDEVYNDGPPFSAFRYFGSNMTMYQAGETEEEKWRDGFGFVIPGAGAVQTRCPNFVPILLEDNFPWDTVRSRKGNLENGVYQSDGLEGQGIYNCQESRAETVFASAAFQFQGDDEAYLWITNVTDWAVGHSFDDSKHAYDYNNSRPNWTSYLASWTPGSNIRVDDFGKSVRWSGNGPLGDTHSSFATPAVWVVDNLKTEPNGENQGPGIWVWHTGRYRASPIYLSYALKEDVLYPNRYRHFAGFDDMTSENPEEWIPRWRTNESDAVPVIQDFAGEISAVWNHWTEKFNVFYHVNTAGQQGIVMREATFPWGVYGWKRLMVDCRDLDKKVDSLDGYFSGIWEGKGGGCYGGYTHPDLWTCDDEQDILNVRFNISLWNPYKVLLVEAQVPYDGPCE